LRHIFEDFDIAADIKKRRLEWTGHPVIMYHENVVKKISENKAGGKRRTGKPRMRWLEDAGDDLQEMNVKEWRQKAVNRKEWVFVIKDAKAVGSKSK
jgi:hypothetical protein